jgi:hypothetical protein
MDEVPAPGRSRKTLSAAEEDVQFEAAMHNSHAFRRYAEIVGPFGIPDSSTGGTAYIRSQEK